jgi:hypothetical protein
LIALLLLAGCRGRVRAERARLYEDLRSWLLEHALAQDRVAVQEEGLAYFASWPTVNLPPSDDGRALLEALRSHPPDYVVAFDDAVWDAVRAHPWFRERYAEVHAAFSPYDAASPLTLWRYRWSPFDDQEGQLAVSGRLEAPEVGTLVVQDLRILPQRVEPESPLHVQLVWSTPTGLNEPLRLVLRLVSIERGRVWLEAERTEPGGVAADLWLPDVPLVEELTLVPPAGLPEGRYRLEAAFYRPGGEPLSASEPSERGEGLSLVTLEHPPDVSRTRPDPQVARTIHFGEEIELIGYDLPAVAHAGERVRVVLYWHVLQAPTADYKVFVHLLDWEGQLLAQDDGKPVHWSYPTTEWQAGEYVRDEHVLYLEPGSVRDNVQVTIGLYDAETGRRLPISEEGGDILPDERLFLDLLRVR